MTYLTAEARQQLLDEIADAIDELGTALAVLGAAYELLDERSADRLEEELFGAGPEGLRPREAHARRLRRALRAARPRRSRSRPPACPRATRARSWSARSRRSTRPTTRSSSCRTRCCRSRSATPSCAPGWPRSARWSSNCPRQRAAVPAHARALTHSSSGPRKEMFGWNGISCRHQPQLRPARGQPLERQPRLELAEARPTQ